MNRRNFIKSVLAFVTISAIPFQWAIKKTKAITARKVKLFINGKEIHYANTIYFEIYDKKTNEPLMVLGRYSPEEVNIIMSVKEPGKLTEMLGAYNETAKNI